MIPKFRGYSQMVVAELISMGISYTGEGWVEGYVIQEGNDSYIINGVIEANSEYISIGEWIPVFADSVGQATGLEDAHGNMIYVGDIINVYSRWFSYPKLVVKFEQGALLVEKDNLFELLSSVSCDSEIIGNIYENPNLLEENQ